MLCLRKHSWRLGIGWSLAEAPPRQCLSDQGTNFVKASKLISEYSQFLLENKDCILSSLATRSIEWRFNPVASPDKGGIWERQIGVAKRILKGLIGADSLFFEEYCTVFTKVESLMNSRPYFPLSPEPNDPLNYLTPSHFLMHSTPSSLPELEIPETACLRKRWDRVRAVTQAFWKKWSREYLHTQMTRDKWPKATPNITVGQVVLVPDVRYSPACWPLGVVVQVHPGSQGAIRVVEVKTPSGVLRRSLNKLAIVPVHTTQESQD